MVNSLNDLIVFENSQGVKARGNLVKVSRSTLIFEVYNPYSIVQLSEVLHNVEIRSDDRVIYRGRAVASGLVNTGLVLIVSASLIDPWSELVGLAGDPATVRSQVAEFVSEWQNNQGIRAGYQLSVSRLRSFLSTLSRWLEHLDFEDSHRPDPSGYPVDDLFPNLVEPLIPTLLSLFQEFERQAAHVDQSERMIHMRYAQDDLHPLLMRAPFVHRAYHKPLGYAGDYEMVNMMLRESREGPTTYAQIINTLYLKTGPAEAHRNRIDILVEWIAGRIRHLRDNDGKRRPRVLSVGCGPAIEVQRLIQREPEIGNCDITLVDFSRDTLAYTEQEMDQVIAASGITPHIEYLHQSVHGLLRQAAKPDEQEKLPVYDVIYCAGLFDYLSDRVCSRLLGLFEKWCSDDGSIMVTNVHPSNPARHWMEHLLEWYLIYRDEPGMQKLGRRFANPKVFADETGVNVFLTFGKSTGPRA